MYASLLMKNIWRRTPMTSTDFQISSAGRRRRAGQALQSDNDINVGSYERLVSAVGGPLLAIYGLSRRSPGGLGLALIGSALFYRGVTGHCQVSEALGVNTAAGQIGPLHVEKSITINRLAEDLYRFWRDVEA
jgi:uncharacterized membrane protein